MKRAGVLLAVLLCATASANVTSGSVHVRFAQVVPVGTPYRGECILEGERVDGRIAYWEIAGVIPAFLRRGVLAPPADELPRLANGPDGDPFGDHYVLQPRMMSSPLDDDCAVRTFDPLGAVTLEQAGPHVFVQYDQRDAFIRVDSTEPVTPQPCAANDPEFPDPSPNIPPPPDIDDGKVWAVSSFCNTTRIVGLAVKSVTRCQRGDMSRWPGNPYINQYDAGARLRLPLRFGYRGGNAAGPSALLMAMLRSAGPRNLPRLTTVYDRTMQRPRRSVRPNQPNEFVAAKAVAFLRSQGWSSARVRNLGTTVQQIESRLLTSLARGPVVVSTAFGQAAWGRTGDGNVITILGADRRGNFIVQDPAGNYFSSANSGAFRRGGHYGPGSCGHRALYPHYWLLAYAVGRYVVELGPRT